MEERVFMVSKAVWLCLVCTEHNCGQSDYRKDSRIQLKIFAHRHVHKDQLVYVISDGVESFLRRGCQLFLIY